MIKSWMEVLSTGNPPSGKPLDPVSRWLVVTRSFSFYQSLLAGAIGGLLAALDGFLDPLLWVLCALGLLLAQAVNNMFNDLLDTRQGIDTEGYPRLRYAPHPLCHGLVSQGRLVLALLVCSLAGAVVGVFLVLDRGWGVLAFPAAGLLAMVCAVAPPLKLKQRGLCEPVNLVVWGPVMIGGTYFVMAGGLPARIWLASLPYGIAVTVGLMAKYLDRMEMDRLRWVLTWPVLLGETRSRRVTQFLVWAFYLLVAALTASGVYPWPAALVFVSLPGAGRLLAALEAPAPSRTDELLSRGERVVPEHARLRMMVARAPGDPPDWPFWYGAWGDWWKRLAGVLLVLGLLAGLLVRWFANLF